MSVAQVLVQVRVVPYRSRAVPAEQELPETVALLPRPVVLLDRPMEPAVPWRIPVALVSEQVPVALRVSRAVLLVQRVLEALLRSRAGLVVVLLVLAVPQVLLVVPLLLETRPVVP